VKIVFATDQYWPSISGVSVSVDAFRTELIRLGHQVIVLAPEYPESFATDDPSTQTQHLFRFASMGLLFNDENRLVRFSEREKIDMLLLELKPDVIHVHTEFSLGRMVSQYARKHHVPLVMTAHTNWEELVDLYLPWFPKFLSRLYCRYHIRRSYNLANALVVPTTLMDHYLSRLSLRCPSTIIPTGIDPIDFEVTEPLAPKTHSMVYQRFPQLKGKRVLFFVGRLGREKNIPFLFQVLASVLQTEPNTMLLLAGDGPARKELEQEVTERGLAANVVFAGFVARKDLREYYFLADVFVFASKVESQGLVALEAMICGTPVVAIGKMGTREIMGGDNGGYMVDDDLAEFSSCVTLLLQDKQVYAEKCREALRHVEKWTMQAQAIKMLDLYETLVTAADSAEEQDELHDAAATGLY